MAATSQQLFYHFSTFISYYLELKIEITRFLNMGFRIESDGSNFLNKRISSSLIIMRLIKFTLNQSAAHLYLKERETNAQELLPWLWTTRLYAVRVGYVLSIIQRKRVIIKKQKLWLKLKLLQRPLDFYAGAPSALLSLSSYFSHVNRPHSLTSPTRAPTFACSSPVMFLYCTAALFSYGCARFRFTSNLVIWCRGSFVITKLSCWASNITHLFFLSNLEEDTWQ